MNKKELVSAGKQMDVILEAMNNHKSVGQVRFLALDVNDNEIIIEGIIFDEELDVWKDINDSMEFSHNWEEAFIEYASKILLTNNLTCRYAFFGKIIEEENLAIPIDLEKVKILLECYGYIVNRLSERDKNVKQD